MKTPSISQVVSFVLCSLVTVGVELLAAPPSPQDNNQNNNNQNNNPPPKPKVVPRVAMKKKTKPNVVEPVVKKITPPIQKRVEQPKLPPGMKRMGPGAAPDQIKDLAKLKLLPPLRRGAGEAGNVAATEGVDVGNAASFPPIGGGSLDQLEDRIRDIAFAEEAGEIGDLAGMLGFADLIDGLDGLVPDLGLGGSGDGSGFADADELAGFGGGGGSRGDGLPDDAPPSGIGFGGFASYDGSEPPASSAADVSKDPETGVVTKVTQWTNYGDDGSLHTHHRSESSNGDTHSSDSWTDSQGYTYRRTRSQAGDGTARTEYRWVNPAGSGGATAVNRTPDGQVSRIQGRISGGGMNGLVNWGDPTYVRPVEVPSWMRDSGTNPGDEGETESQRAFARWMWGKHNLGRHPSGGARPDMGKLVNPGDPDYDGATATYPSIGARFSEAVVINPDPNSMGSGGGTPSAKAWGLMLENLKNGASPGPRPGEGDGRGDR